MRATAAAYTAVELRRKIKDALTKMGTGSVIIQASGPGTSYQRTITMTPNEAVELYTLAIEYKEGRAVNTVRHEKLVDNGFTC